MRGVGRTSDEAKYWAIEMSAYRTVPTAVLLGFIVLSGCRSTAPAWYADPITEQEPFRLILAIPQVAFHHGDTVQVTLTLQNTTTRPLMGCLDYPYGFEFSGADKTNGGLITVSDGGCKVTDEFVLPPGRDLVWSRSITVPRKVTPGAAKVWYYQAVSGVANGRHGSPGFYQKVQSSPLEVTILTSDGDMSAPMTSNHGSQPTGGAPSIRASCSIRAVRAAGG